MNLAKSDALVSIGIILDSNVRAESIQNLHKTLSKTYNYFEILLLKYPQSSLDSNLTSKNNFTPPHYH